MPDLDVPDNATDRQLVPQPSHDFLIVKSRYENNNRKILILAASAVFISFVVFLISYLILLNSKKEVELITPIPRPGLKTNVPEEIRKVPNPITGELYNEDAVPPWISNRPLGIMINNHPDARPQSALYQADIVYEIVAEGGITRFLAFFLTHTPEKIGPVRSAREYYLVLVKELGDAMIMHIGWSPQALVAIESWPVRSLSRGGATFWRENPNNVATEHTAYVNGLDLRKRGDELGWEGTRTLTSWKFKDTKNYAEAKDAWNISVDFWYKGDFSAIWKYNPDKNTYMRYMGYDASDQPLPHLDRETKEQINAENVIVQFARESSILGDDKNRLEYELLGSGKALVFLDGKVVEATWNKAGRDERTKFFDMNGEEIEFNRGNFWIEIVPDRNIDQVVFN